MRASMSGLGVPQPSPNQTRLPEATTETASSAGMTFGANWPQQLIAINHVQVGVHGWGACFPKFLNGLQRCLGAGIGGSGSCLRDTTLLAGGDRPVGHVEACKRYVAGLVLTDHALGEAFDL